MKEPMFLSPHAKDRIKEDSFDLEKINDAWIRAIKIGKSPKERAAQFKNHGFKSLSTFNVYDKKSTIKFVCKKASKCIVIVTIYVKDLDRKVWLRKSKQKPLTLEERRQRNELRQLKKMKKFKERLLAINPSLVTKDK